MPAPTLVSSVPADTTLDVGISNPILLTFSTAIQASSINAGTVQVFRSDDQVPLTGSYTVEGSSSNVVRFIPESTFFQNTLYRIQLIGASSGFTYGILSTTSEFLATTVNLSFRTGEELYVSLTEITSRDDIERVGPIRKEDPLAIIPTGIDSQILSIDSTTPGAFETKVDVTSESFILDFSSLIDASTVSTTSVAITQSPVLGIPEYYAEVPSTSTDGCPVLGDAAGGGGALIPPTGTLSVSGDTVLFTIDPSADLLHNTEVRIVVTTDVASTYGATLGEDYEFYFTTEYYPLWLGAEYLRVELGPAVATLSDDTLCRIIHKNSLEAWELSNRSLNLKKPPWRARKWVGCMSVLDVLGVLLLTRDLREGESKTLGDLSISHKPSDPALNAKYQQAAQCLVDLGDLFDLDATNLAVAAVKGSTSGMERFDFRMRTWDHLVLSGVAGANLQDERGEKARLSVDYALGGKPVSAQQFFLSVSPALR